MFINEKLQEFERYIKNKKVALIGLDKSHVQLLDYFVDCGAKVTVFDKKNMNEIDKSILDKITDRCINFSFGEHYLISLIGFDLILRTPECLPNTHELNVESVRGAIITSEIELVMEMCPGKIIGVTGSKGKTTTARLIYEILKEKGLECYLGGNMGIPLYSKIKEMTPECITVVELSESQLMNMQTSPEIAVITNILQDEQQAEDNEKEINNYKNIYNYQDENGKLVINYDNEITNRISSEANGKVRPFSCKTRLDNGVIYDDGVLKSCVDGVRMHIMTIDDSISLKGIENYENMCAAIAATEDFSDPYTQLRAITKFKESDTEKKKTKFPVILMNNSI